MSTISTNHTEPALAAIESPATRLSWLGWAAFLGASWTWCIGMFLPVILVREYGFWGWVVFAVPNVIGAAAMGWMIRDSRQSEEMVAAHPEACRLFSAVTIAFHLFFVLAVIAVLARHIRDSTQDMDIALGSVLACSALMYIYMTRRGGGGRVLAWIVLAISVMAMICVIREMQYSSLVSSGPARPFAAPFSIELLWLAPVCVFGFLLCPYLDLTFHRARQLTTRSRASFGVGFGVFFLLMIVFTLIYSPSYLQDMSPWVAIFVFVHMAVQSSFTIAAHARELQADSTRPIIIAVVLTLLAWIAYWFLPDLPYVNKLKTGEVIYRLFMGFYGLMFPAYVWLMMIPQRGEPIIGARVRNLAVYILAVLAAGPMFWMGFILQRTIWLVPGLAIVLLARLLVRPEGIQQNSAPI